MELVCSTILLINFYSITGNDMRDFHVIPRAIKVCKAKHNSCVRSIERKEEGVYNVICGKQIKK